MEQILAGDYDELPQDAFRMVATIEDVVAKAKTLR
jgi:F0F1-type ATP synthase beta subunit